ncbi:MAG: deoxyribodipyrimidine photo-lyase [Bryobacterales bacterium]|nr:deoxyribodipyrimidine photo-lyase [Bryobacterales bacterium]
MTADAGPPLQLVIFRRDLRVEDNPALVSALEAGPAIGLYVLDDNADGRPLGEAARWWLHHALMDLRLALADLGVPLILRKGSQRDEVIDVAGCAQVRAVHWNRRYTAAGIRADRSLSRELRRRGTQCCTFEAGYLRKPGEVRTRSGGLFRVFTPFSRALRELGDPPEPLAAPSAKSAPIVRGTPVRSEALQGLSLLPRSRSRRSGLSEAWAPASQPATSVLSVFLESRIDEYHECRDRPDLEGVSRLSPYLAFGQISARQVWHAVKRRCGPNRAGRGMTAFLRQLAWRDFCVGLLVQAPDLAERPFRKEYDQFPWRHDEASLQAWQNGATGYPWIDAGMRQLAVTGWMHNRVRMAVGSFLTKDLLLPWQAGERWFWDQLVDADPAQNAANWQWVAGCGADAAPYFRIFNPTLQGQRFDPEGKYRSRWLPQSTGYGPGEAGVAPIVDHRRARARALHLYKEFREAG